MVVQYVKKLSLIEKKGISNNNFTNMEYDFTSEQNEKNFKKDVLKSYRKY